MDKNTIIGFILIGLLLFGYSWMSRPSQEQLEQQKAIQRYNDSIMQVENAKLSAAQNSQFAKDSLSNSKTDSSTLIINEDSLHQQQLQETYGIFSRFAEGQEKKLKLKNEYITLTFDNKGGVIKEAILNNYKTYDSLPLTLFNGEENNYGFIFKAGGRIVKTSDLYFEPIKSADGNSIAMRLNFGNNRFFEIAYTLEPQSYMVKMDIHQKGMDKILPLNTTNLDMYWEQTMRRQEKGRMFEERNSALYYKFVGSDVDNLSESKDEQENISVGIKWFGYKNQFFSTAIIADSKFNGGLIKSNIEHSDKYLKQFSTETTFDYNPASEKVSGFRIFMGPNLYPLLHSYDKKVPSNEQLDLDKLVPLGYKFFRWINTWFIIPMFTFFGKFIDNYGIIILLMTIVIKIFLAPLTFKSYMSTARMRVLRPQIEEINAKYPGQDKAMERQRATMDLYSKAGINPMSGCLPMLLQMPILLAMFAFFPSSIELRQQSFLWADDLSSYDAIFSWDAYIPIITPYFGNHISLFCLLMTITNILYTKINMDSTAGQQQMPGMKMMMYLMPLMFLFIFNNYASGLSYYYFVSLLITIIQTYVFRKCINEEKVLAKLKENQKKPRKKSGFMARLEEAQRQQEAALRQQRKNRR
ncbi:membrane protein insertase YidC [Coprobacter secundus]|uniref:Membrane protein insertase YidC n=1 Tax=Coprobacter secundus subsp. similis TaxID=2751153 RepID=A0A7G1HXX1_9BACT|nr:membrane protein insertase YidC [Coprobacter secundus]BCI64496.1 membrane protein insertase YidC [Coprobacter secundus subsp. similis]CCY39148.1 membrane protein insertase YidC [Tannerella sp. CAG:118]